MATAMTQTYWLARDSLGNPNYVVSQWPLSDYGADGGRTWEPRAAKHGNAYTLFPEDMWEQLTADRYTLEPGAEPREVLLELIVNDANDP